MGCTFVSKQPIRFLNGGATQPVQAVVKLIRKTPVAGIISIKPVYVIVQFTNCAELHMKAIVTCGSMHSVLGMSMDAEYLK